jgi:hypothetical protein
MDELVAGVGIAIFSIYILILLIDFKKGTKK